MSDGHPNQDAVAAARDWRDGWRGIVSLVKMGHSPIDVSAKSKARYTLAANDELERLEALVNRIANTDPIHRFTCTFCGSYCLDTPHVHAPDCIWSAAQAAKE